MEQDRKSTYRASASSDDAVKGQGIGDTKGHSSRTSRGLGIDGRFANGFGLLVPKDGSPSRVDIWGTTVSERIDHIGWRWWRVCMRISRRAVFGMGRRL